MTTEQERKKRNDFKRLRRKAQLVIDDIHREYLITHALVYFLGSTLLAKSPKPSNIYGFLNPVFAFLHDARYVLAVVLMAFAVLLCCASFVRRQTLASFLFEKLTSVWATMPLLFFTVTFLNDVVELLKSGENDIFGLVEYILGISLLTAVMIWLVRRRWKAPHSRVK